MRDDLRSGLHALPIWMQAFVRSLLASDLSVAAQDSPHRAKY
jgi:hypothetical protein